VTDPYVTVTGSGLANAIMAFAAPAKLHRLATHWDVGVVEIPIATTTIMGQ